MTIGSVIRASNTSRPRNGRRATHHATITPVTSVMAVAQPATFTDSSSGSSTSSDIGMVSSYTFLYSGAEDSSGGDGKARKVVAGPTGTPARSRAPPRPRRTGSRGVDSP